MFLKQFRYLVALEQERHFGRAAERCNVSQPSLSSAIKHLEEELGIPIIQRDQKFQGFTEEGRRVVEWSKRILADRKAMLEELALMHRNLGGRIRIGAMPMSSPVLPLISQLFSQQHPGVQISIQFLGLEQMKLGLTNFQLDVGVTYLDQAPLEHLDVLPIYEERFSLLVPDNGWLKEQKSATWAEAAELPLGLLPPYMHERQVVDAAFAGIGCIPHPRLESDSIMNLAFHVMQGDFATIIPSHFMRISGAYPGTCAKDLLEPAVAQKVGVVWVRGDPMLPMTKALVELLQEVIQSGKFNERLMLPSKQ
jgi:DNA-binding transcriptional LysR family regulator